MPRRERSEQAAESYRPSPEFSPLALLSLLPSTRRPRYNRRMPLLPESAYTFIDLVTGKRTSKAEWRNTSRAEDRLRQDMFYEERGLIRKEKRFAGRPIISRDKPINGGVYLGSGTREAIVVDDEKDPALDKIYQELVQRIKQHEANGENVKGVFLAEVYNIIQDVMPSSPSNVDRLTEDLEPDTKIYLSGFIGGGVCRHHALLGGYLLERLAKDGYAGGKVSVDRNQVPDRGGHAWVRYQSSSGEIYIIDASQHFIGKLSDIRESDNRWFYERPSDRNPAWNLVKRVLGRGPKNPK